jgi:hypothetical protein
VLGGLLAATFLAFFLSPMFYLVVESLADKVGMGRKMAVALVEPPKLSARSPDLVGATAAPMA